MSFNLNSVLEQANHLNGLWGKNPDREEYEDYSIMVAKQVYDIALGNLQHLILRGSEEKELGVHLIVNATYVPGLNGGVYKQSQIDYSVKKNESIVFIGSAQTLPASAQQNFENFSKIIERIRTVVVEKMGVVQKQDGNERLVSAVSDMKVLEERQKRLSFSVQLSIRA